MATVLIVPLAGGLVKKRIDKHHEKVLLDRRTTLACDTALELARKWRTSRSADVTILAPASMASRKFKYAWMGYLMQDYMILHSDIGPANIFRREASEFTTYGEISAAIDFLQERWWHDVIYDKLILVAETWREKRVAMILNTILQANAGKNLPCCWIETFDSKGGFWKDEVYWPLYEFIARIKNRWRLSKLRPAHP